MGYWRQREIWEGHGPTGVRFTIYLKHLADDAQFPWNVQYGRNGHHAKGHVFGTYGEAWAEIVRLQAELGAGWKLLWKDAAPRDGREP